MSGGFLTRYANQAIPPEARAAFFVQGESRLTWTSLFFQAFPNADIYLVGGTLRDAIMGRVPNDVDIVIRNVEIEELQRWLQSHGAYEFVGKNFGTFKFSPHGCASQSPIDIALPRTERIGEEHASGRRDLEVRFNPRITIKEDLGRRDFTINAIAYDIRHNNLIDPYDGLVDLGHGLIRAVRDPNERFFEDASRLLRALRFASQLSFAIEEHTWKAVKQFISLLDKTKMLDDGTHAFVVPREAIGKEFLLGFIQHPVHTLRLWQESGALELFLPDISKLEHTIEDNDVSAFEKTQDLLHVLHKPSFLRSYRKTKASGTLLVAGLFAFLEGELAQHAVKTCKKLHFHQFPKGHRGHVNCKDVLWLTENLHHFEHTDPASMRPSAFEKKFCTNRGEELLMLMHAFYIASGKHTVARERLLTARRIAGKMADHICSGPKGKLPELISGYDLQELGMKPGPHFREAKDVVRDAQLTHKIQTKEEARQLIQQWLAENA